MLLQYYRFLVLFVAFAAVGLVFWIPIPGCSEVTRDEEQTEQNQPEDNEPSGSGAQPLNVKESLEVRVTVHAFSGRPDPHWQLDRKQIAKLAALLDELEPITLDKPWGPPSRLGYKGFSVRITPQEGSNTSLFVYDNIAQGRDGFGSKKGVKHQLEKWLVTSGGSAVKRNVRKVVLRDIRALGKGSGRNLNRNRRGTSSGAGSPERKATE